MIKGLTNISANGKPKQRKHSTMHYMHILSLLKRVVGSPGRVKERRVCQAQCQRWTGVCSSPQCVWHV